MLAEITQPEEWRAEPAVGDISGLDELRERDPQVSRQEIEDRIGDVLEVDRSESDRQARQAQSLL